MPKVSTRDVISTRSVTQRRASPQWPPTNGKTQKVLLRALTLELTAHPLPLSSWFHYLSCTSHWISHRVPNWEYLSRKTAIRARGHWLLTPGSCPLARGHLNNCHVREMQELGTQCRGGLKWPEDSGSQVLENLIPFFMTGFHVRERKVYEPTPEGGIIIAVRVYDEDESYGLWLNTQRQQISNDRKRRWETQLVSPKPYNINYHILAYGSTLNYFAAKIRLLMRCRIELLVNLAFIYLSKKIEYTPEMGTQHLERLPLKISN